MSRSSISPAACCLLLMLGLFSVATAAEPARGSWHHDVDAAWAQTKASNRPMLLLATTDHCLYCEQLKEKTFADPETLHELQQAFVLATVQAADQPSLMRKLQIHTFPTTVIVAPDGKVLDRIEGYLNASKFRARVHPIARVSALPGETH